MKALDLYCGLGGWSDGLALECFDVLGVEIDPEIAGIMSFCFGLSQLERRFLCGPLKGGATSFLLVPIVSDPLYGPP
ncbi:hypothetical protein ES703_102642 [subsurface metagenome]